jgi:hypothetical protein
VSTEIDTSMVSEIVFSDVLSMAQTIGIIGTLALTFFFYKKHIRHLAVDTETEILRDLDDKVHRLNEMSFEHPELTKIQTNRPIRLDTIYAFDVLLVYQQAFKMYQRRVLKENDWYGWFHWMRNSFREGTIKDHWKEIEVSGWFGPRFRNFINNDVIGP